MAYLITFRTYGTWLHGDERSSMNRRQHNQYGTPKIAPSQQLVKAEQAQLKQLPVTLNQAQRVVVEQAIRDVCTHRGYQLLAVNVRTNHVHCVVAATCEPEMVMNTFKAYATRYLREGGLLSLEVKPWSRHGSNPYLWTPEQVERAVDYVINGQGDVPWSFK